jgi:hypothetical protein
MIKLPSLIVDYPFGDKKMPGWKPGIAKIKN